MEPHGATLYTSDTTGAVWKPFKLGLEMHEAAWNRMEPHGAAFVYYLKFTRWLYVAPCISRFNLKGLHTASVAFEVYTVAPCGSTHF